ncbi:hypothetical protein SGPA1_21288 [Streptomyces misionensis JCM 4497]
MSQILWPYPSAAMCRYQRESQEWASVLSSGRPRRALVRITARIPVSRTAANRARAGTAPSGVPRRAIRGRSKGPARWDGAAGSGRGTEEVLTLLTLGTPGKTCNSRLGFLTHFHPESGIGQAMGVNPLLPQVVAASATPVQARPGPPVGCDYHMSAA